MSHQHQQAQSDMKEQEEQQEESDRVPLLALMTEYLTITYKHCRQQTQQQQQPYSGSGQQNKPKASVPTIPKHQAITETHAGSLSATGSTSRRVLTKKAEPAGNGGLDNEDRNLIVHVRDILGDDSGARANSSSSSIASTSVSSRYVVLDLLGQGTFGQVFRCQHLITKQIVAVKVIRNHPSYYKQAIVEVQITRMLNRHYGPEDSQHIVRLLHNFEFQSHLCLVFELLSMNVYELIAENNFRGFPLDVTQGFVRQILHALVQLTDAGVIHCDLKPENILLAGILTLATTTHSASTSQDQLFTAPPSNSHHHYFSQQSPATAIPLLKVVDFGSACLENETVYSYIQSRFYRSPEVLLGIPYNGAIDMWSLGCIAFEMLLGLPLFPGVSEHDQLCLIEETLGQLPQYLLKKGRNVLKFYDVHIRQRAAGFSSNEEFVLKTPEQFAKEADSEVRVAKKYFKYSKLADLVHAYPFRASATPAEIIYEQERRQAFLHFLNGLLIVDPAARWTAREALRHPFITGERFVDESSGARNESILSSQSGSLPSSCYYQQQPQEHQQHATMQYAGLPHMVAMGYQQQQQQMPIPQRVCPVNACYLDASDQYINGGEPFGSYAYNQPWTPAYTTFSMGNEGNYVYNSISHQQAPHEHPSPLQPQFCWDVPPYESFQSPVPRMKHKVTPVPPTGSLVIPMHSPVYSFPPRPEFPYHQQQVLYTYDPSFMLPLERQHPISVAPMDHQQFRTPPKLHQHHRQQSHKASTAHRSTRRRRQTQPRIPETGLSLPNLGPVIYTNDTTHQVNTDVNSRGPARHVKPIETTNHHRQVHKSKRRNENSSDVSEQAQRLWKSPRAALDRTADGRSTRDGSPGRASALAEREQRLEEHGDDTGGGYWVTPQSEEDMYFAEASFNSATQCSLATPAPPLPT